MKEDYKQFAFRFVEALASREYATAYVMMSEQFMRGTSVDRLQKGFESMLSIYSNQKVTHIEIFEPEELLKDWLGRNPKDVGFVYVSIAGENGEFVEAVSVVVSKEGDQFKIREVEFGRP